jgi:hypothetical protein
MDVFSVDGFISKRLGIGVDIFVGVGLLEFFF